jgi:eukaryotic-like serine/threonine-protein kinase
MTPDRWRQIEQLYDAARQCAPSDRAVLLEATDRDIRDRVQRMLEIESGSGILGQSPADFLADPTKTVVAPGAQLGPYKIEAQIGSGGMGTVYRAIDTRLGRVVAIKIATERYTARFQLEAQAISTLNHPNICTLYDVGSNYLVMEFIEGSTLAAELKNGPLAPETAARHGAQIAGALAEAHSLGIVHRDLKPSNIMLTRHGVKVVDFGLAKLSSETGITETGRILGTPAYMSPEQSEGRAPTPASDLYSLGLVLHEMATGKLPSRGVAVRRSSLNGPGEDITALIAQLLDPAPERRPSSAGEVRDQLRTLAANPPRRTRAIAAGVVLLLVLLAAGGWLLHRWMARSTSIRQVNSIVRITNYAGDEQEPSLSPDGSAVAFSWIGDRSGNRDIYIQQIGSGQPARRLTQDQAQDNYPAWSPDGKQIAFLRAKNPRVWEIRLIPAAGGVDHKLRDILLDTDANIDSHPLLAWSPAADQLVFTHADQQARTRLFVLTLQTGAVRALDLGSVQSIMGDSAPAISPDGRWLAFRRAMGGYNAAIMVQPLKSGLEPDGQPMGVSSPLANPAWPSWSPDSRHLIFADSNRIFEWGPGGIPRLLYTSTTVFDGLAAAWPDGRLRAIASSRSANFNIWSLPLDPSSHRASGPPVRRVPSSASDDSVSFSPDGKRFAFTSNRTGSREIWMADRDGANLKQLTHLGASGAGYPRWSPDGKRIIFHAGMPGVPSQIYLLDPESRALRKLTNAPLGFIAPDWLPDGLHVVAWRNVNGEGQIFRVRLSDGLGEELFAGTVPVLSLDRKRVLYGKFLEPGMFARSTRDLLKSPEQEIVPDYRVTFTSGLSPAAGGVYYVAFTPHGDSRAFSYFDYATRHAIDVAPVPAARQYGLTVSPDQRELLYSATNDPFGDDLIMLDFEAPSQ